MARAYSRPSSLPLPTTGAEHSREQHWFVSETGRLTSLIPVPVGARAIVGPPNQGYQDQADELYLQNSLLFTLFQYLFSPKPPLIPAYGLLLSRLFLKNQNPGRAPTETE